MKLGLSARGREATGRDRVDETDRPTSAVRALRFPLMITRMDCVSPLPDIQRDSHAASASLHETDHPADLGLKQHVHVRQRRRPWGATLGMHRPRAPVLPNPRSRRSARREEAGEEEEEGREVTREAKEMWRLQPPIHAKEEARHRCSLELHTTVMPARRLAH